MKCQINKLMKTNLTNIKKCGSNKQNSGSKYILFLLSSAFLVYPGNMLNLNSQFVSLLFSSKIWAKVSLWKLHSQHEKCPNTEVFLDRISPHSGWIWRDNTLFPLVYIATNQEEIRLMFFKLRMFSFNIFWSCENEYKYSCKILPH